ncbi:hypothetical protein [Rhodopseudomonas sp.]|uniref:hypothetical protein n=1 Tax=Rhodopseudomonas sp. TaxID=1078 RepID=UPI003B3BAE82
MAEGFALCADADEESQELGAINAVVSNNALRTDLRPAFAPASIEFITRPQLLRRTNRMYPRASTWLQSFCVNQIWNWSNKKAVRRRRDARDGIYRLDSLGPRTIAAARYAKRAAVLNRSKLNVSCVRNVVDLTSRLVVSRIATVSLCF